MSSASGIDCIRQTPNLKKEVKLKYQFLFLVTIDCNQLLLQITPNCSDQFVEMGCSGSSLSSPFGGKEIKNLTKVEEKSEIFSPVNNSNEKTNEPLIHGENSNEDSQIPVTATENTSLLIDCNAFPDISIDVTRLNEVVHAVAVEGSNVTTAQEEIEEIEKADKLFISNEDSVKAIEANEAQLDYDLREKRTPVNSTDVSQITIDIVSSSNDSASPRKVGSDPNDVVSDQTDGSSMLNKFQAYVEVTKSCLPIRDNSRLDILDSLPEDEEVIVEKVIPTKKPQSNTSSPTKSTDGFSETRQATSEWWNNQSKQNGEYSEITSAKEMSTISNDVQLMGAKRFLSDSTIESVPVTGITQVDHKSGPLKVYSLNLSCFLFLTF